METATFAAEGIADAADAFRALDGVHATRVGHIEDPACEALEVDFDPWRVSFDDLLDVLLQRVTIYPHTVEQHVAASGRPLAEIAPAAGRFVPSAPS